MRKKVCQDHIFKSIINGPVALNNKINHFQMIYGNEKKSLSGVVLFFVSCRHSCMSDEDLIKSKEGWA